MSDDYQAPPPAPPAPAPAAPPPAGGGAPSDTGKILAGIGYLTGIVALIAILIEPYKDERFVRVHAFQALALYVVMIVASVLNVIPVLGQIVWLVASIAVFVFAIIGAVKAFQGQEYEMPIVYGFIKNYI
ncbi:MAG: DUF4870 domain-containing protein [Coriobacteriia bacterium]|nr:DUF4870 domain-containing protein [Coriobacteriia bacterium]MBN2841162.1 DUF4870 domain-containing protein [Coriobacteriia bacterium]